MICPICFNLLQFNFDKSEMKHCYSKKEHTVVLFRNNYCKLILISKQISNTIYYSAESNHNKTTIMHWSYPNANYTLHNRIIIDQMYDLCQLQDLISKYTRTIAFT